MYRRHSPRPSQSISVKLIRIPIRLNFSFCLFFALGFWARLGAGTPHDIVIPGLQDGLNPQAIAQIRENIDETNRLHFSEAETIAEALIQAYPQHPLPKMFLQATLFAEIQERLEAHLEDPALMARFQAASDAVVQSASLREAKDPKDALARFYLGSSLGACGVVLLYQHHYIDAYHDGQRAYTELLNAIRLEPRLWDADLGLGTFEYASAKLAGLLRLILHIHGDEKGGLARLQLCASGGGLAAVAAQFTLARVYCFEDVDYAKAFPYVQELCLRYPENYVPIRELKAMVEGEGLDNGDLLCLTQEVVDNGLAGWRPPAYVKLDLSGLEHALAEHFLMLGEPKLARPYLQPYAASANNRYVSS